MKEEIDLVNAHDEIIGKTSRDEAHKKGLLHRAVIVMLFDPDGNLYVQQRAPSKDLYPSAWEGSLSGHVLSGEVSKEAAERELHEELGVCVTPKHLRKVLTFGLHDEEERVLATLYVVKDYKGSITLDEDEVKAGGFWSWKKLESELAGKKRFHPLFRKAVDEFKALGEKTREFVKV